MITEQSTPSTEDEYQQLRALMRDRVESIVDQSTPLFTTDAEGLFDLFLSHLPEAHRQHYRCNCCRQFINRFGGLVSIDSEGLSMPVMWPVADVAPLFQAAVTALSVAVYRAKVTGVFMSSDFMLGTPVTGEWTHFHAELPADWQACATSKIKTAHQLMAGKSEDYKTVCGFLGDYKLEHIREAMRILETGTLTGSEKAIGPVRWLLELFRMRGELHSVRRVNATWLAIAKAPAGFCHPRASILGEIIDQVKSGATFESIARRMGQMTDPLKYQRSQTLPTAGNIARAEEIFEKMNLGSALRRRYARFDEIEKLWIPKPPAAQDKPSGIFGHIPTKDAMPAASPIETPPITITWEKFRRTILDKVESLQFLVAGGQENFIGMTTAADPESERILRWGNDVAWYVYNGGSYPSRWHLSTGWCEVTGITTLPCHWDGAGKHPQFDQRIILLLDGAWDAAPNLALFPNCLKSELHEVRSTIEAYSMRGKLECASKEEATACGIAIDDASRERTVRAWHDGAWNTYKIDRLD